MISMSKLWLGFTNLTNLCWISFLIFLHGARTKNILYNELSTWLFNLRFGFLVPLNFLTPKFFGPPWCNVCALTSDEFSNLKPEIWGNILWLKLYSANKWYSSCETTFQNICMIKKQYFVSTFAIDSLSNHFLKFPVKIQIIYF